MSPLPALLLLLLCAERAHSKAFIVPVPQDWRPIKPKKRSASLRIHSGAVSVRGALSEEDLERVLEAERAAGEDAELQAKGLVSTTRKFGDSDIYGNHTVTFMHRYIGSMLDEVKRIAFAALAKAGWDVGYRADELHVRCVESIRYTAGKGAAGEHGLGWHDDESSILTAAVAMSAPSEYTGGALEVIRERTETLPLASRGDVTVWRAWDLHRVTALRTGHRHVFVVEWWPYSENHARSTQGRPPPPGGDDALSGLLLERCRRTVAADGGSPMLLSVCAQEQLRVGSHSASVSLFRKAATLAPSWINLWEGIAAGELAAAGGDVNTAIRAAEAAETALRLRRKLQESSPDLHDVYEDGESAWSVPSAMQTVRKLRQFGSELDLSEYKLVSEVLRRITS